MLHTHLFRRFPRLNNRSCVVQDGIPHVRRTLMASLWTAVKAAIAFGGTCGLRGSEACHIEDRLLGAAERMVAARALALWIALTRRWNRVARLKRIWGVLGARLKQIKDGDR